MQGKNKSFKNNSLGSFPLVGGGLNSSPIKVGKSYNPFDIAMGKGIDLSNKNTTEGSKSSIDSVLRSCVNGLNSIATFTTNSYLGDIICDICLVVHERSFNVNRVILTCQMSLAQQRKPGRWSMGGGGRGTHACAVPKRNLLHQKIATFLF